MKTYVVYEVHAEHPILRRIDTVKANTSESARRKAIIGTSKEYNKTRAFRDLKWGILLCLKNLGNN